MLGQLRVPAIERKPDLSRRGPSRLVTTRRELERHRLPRNARRRRAGAV